MAKRQAKSLSSNVQLIRNEAQEADAKANYSTYFGIVDKRNQRRTGNGTHRPPEKGV